MNGEGEFYIYIYIYIYTHTHIYVHRHIYVYIHTHNGILVIQKNEILQVATIWCLVKYVRETQTWYVISYM